MEELANKVPKRIWAMITSISCCTIAVGMDIAGIVTTRYGYLYVQVHIFLWVMMIIVEMLPILFAFLNYNLNMQLKPCLVISFIAEISLHSILVSFGMRYIVFFIFSLISILMGIVGYVMIFILFEESFNKKVDALLSAPTDGKTIYSQYF